MKLQDYIDEIKLELTGGLLELEIPDTTIARIVNMALREVQRYIDIPKLITVPYAKCIDLTDFKHDSIVKVYRTTGYSSSENGDTLMNDPMYQQQWMVFSNGGSMYNLDNYLMNFMSYSTLMQMRNTLSTDLSFREDKQAKKLYINSSYDIPKMITIEYIPIYDSVEEVEDDYWTDIIKRLSLALTKVTLGRIRSHVKQSNALWTLDGDQLLQEGNQELTDLRTTLKDNMPFIYPTD
ncbi:MAG: hypothetical protein SO009_03750 [Bacilli bacterium]|nr:hypothetical protein [Bacilli bacterium]